MNRSTLLFALLFSAVALAETREDAVARALDSVEEAQDEAEDAAGSCKRSLKGLESLGDKLTSLKKDVTDKGLSRAKDQAEELSEAAKDDCKGSLSKRVRKSLDKAVDQLERAQAMKTASAPVEDGKTVQQGGNVLVSLAGGIGALFGGGASKTTTNKTETNRSSRTEEINGKSIDDEEPAPRKKSSKSEGSSRGGFQATCSKNTDCDSNTCFVGNGNLGYCTKMCNGFSECPSFWECKRPGNAPQSICMQD